MNYTGFIGYGFAIIGIVSTVSIAKPELVHNVATNPIGTIKDLPEKYRVLEGDVNYSTELQEFVEKFSEKGIDSVKCISEEDYKGRNGKSHRKHFIGRLDGKQSDIFSTSSDGLYEMLIACANNRIYVMNSKSSATTEDSIAVAFLTRANDLSISYSRNPSIKLYGDSFSSLNSLLARFSKKSSNSCYTEQERKWENTEFNDAFNAFARSSLR